MAPLSSSLPSVVPALPKGGRRHTKRKGVGQGEGPLVARGIEYKVSAGFSCGGYEGQGEAFS